MCMCNVAQSFKFDTSANFKRRGPASLILPIRFETGSVNQQWSGMI